VYVVDLCEFAVRESSASGDGGGGCGSFAYANDVGEGGRAARAGGDAAALGDAPSHVSELRGHAKAVTCLALLDPSDLAARSSGGGDDVGGVGTSPTLLASGSEDGTIRVWDLRARSCVRVLRPWSGTSAEGGGANVASSSSSSSSAAAPSPPVTSIVIVPRSSLTSHGGASLAMSSADRCSGRRRDADGCSATPYRPLRGFVRGSSVISHGGGGDDGVGSSSSSGECVPILWPRRDESFAGYWEGPTPTANNGALIAPSRKRTRRPPSSRGGRGEVDRLRKELAESKRTIERWQAVNRSN